MSWGGNKTVSFAHSQLAQLAWAINSVDRERPLREIEEHLCQLARQIDSVRGHKGDSELRHKRKALMKKIERLVEDIDESSSSSSSSSRSSRSSSSGSSSSRSSSSSDGDARGRRRRKGGAKKKAKRKVASKREKKDSTARRKAKKKRKRDGDEAPKAPTGDRHAAPPTPADDAKDADDRAGPSPEKRQAR